MQVGLKNTNKTTYLLSRELLGQFQSQARPLWLSLLGLLFGPFCTPMNMVILPKQHPTHPPQWFTALLWMLGVGEGCLRFAVISRTLTNPCLLLQNLTNSGTCSCSYFRFCSFVHCSCSLFCIFFLPDFWNTSFIKYSTWFTLLVVSMS